MNIDINKIGWRTANRIQLNHYEWNSIVDSLLEEGYRESESELKTVKREFPFGSFRFADDRRDKELYVVDWEGNLIVFYTMNDNDKNDLDHVGGNESFKYINEKFKAETGSTLISAFGTWPRKEKNIKESTKNETIYHYELENCVSALPALIECDEFFKYHILENVYKADISSAYPYQLTLPLPTLKGAVGPLQGAIEPFDGYVSYWVKSGHIIEGRAGGVDTRKFLDHPLYGSRHKYSEVDDCREVTYLLPYSKHSLSNIIYDLYDQRKNNPKAKGIMNSFVGKLCSRKEFQKNYMGHISAIVYARHINYMCSLYNNLIKANCYPIMYATDSILWLGGPCPIATKDKYLGSFTLEYSNCRAVYLSCGNYAIEIPETKQLALVKHQGISADEWKTFNVQTLEDFRTRDAVNISEKYNKKTHKYELYKKVEI